VTAKYLPTVTRTTTPTRLIAFCVDASPDEPNADRSMQRREFRRVHFCYSVFKRASWGKEEWGHADSPRKWWDHVYNRASDGHVLTLVSPCGFDDLTLLDVQNEMEHNRLRLWCTPGVKTETTDRQTGFAKRFRGRMMTGNPPDVLVVMSNAGPIRCLSLENYTTATLDELAESAGLACRGTTSAPVCSLVRGWCAKDAAAVASATFRSLCDWWRTGQCGPWRDTISQLSISLFKRHYLKHRILIHDDPDATRLELAALHGPRQSVWFFGDIGEHPGRNAHQQAPPDRSNYPPEPGPCWRADVRSQYPFLLTHGPFPSRLMGTAGEMPPEHLRAMLRVWGAVARVRIRTGRAEFPLKGDKYTTYPTGTFTTTLAGPELIDALDAGEVERVYEVAHYQLDDAYAEFGRWLWETRLQYRRTGDTAGETWTKLMGNSFVGKHAQKPGRWIDLPGTEPRQRWGVYFVALANGGGVAAERGIAGHRQTWDRNATGRAIGRAVFAYVTSLARLQMRALRRLLAPHEVYAQHTDCLWVSESGYERLVQVGKIQPEEFGGLKATGPHAYMRFLSPAHRYCDGRWTVGGIAEGFAVAEHCRFSAEFRCNPDRKTMTGERGTVSIHRRTLNLSAVGTPSQIGSDGWAVPWHHAPTTDNTPDHDQGDKD
jgi:hypothetical protein